MLFTSLLLMENDTNIKGENHSYRENIKDFKQVISYNSQDSSSFRWDYQHEGGILNYIWNYPFWLENNLINDWLLISKDGWIRSDVTTRWYHHFYHYTAFLIKKKKKRALPSFSTKDKKTLEKAWRTRTEAPL